QFDTIYHENFHYHSLGTVQRIFNAHGLELYDVEELPTHGGSLRIYAAHRDYGAHMREAVQALLAREREFGLEDVRTYTGFSDKMQNIKLDTLGQLSQWKQAGKRIAAFGAAAKGNPVLHYSGIKTDLIDFVVDSNPHKQGLYLPGSLIPIVGREALRERRPDYLLILPWNLRDEIIEAAGVIREWGGQFAVCIPQLDVF
ncbi:MAG: SAM-dependent methyltransferase, partial [Oscillospiraceae bacterium]